MSVLGTKSTSYVPMHDEFPSFGMYLRMLTVSGTLLTVLSLAIPNAHPWTLEKQKETAKNRHIAYLNISMDNAPASGSQYLCGRRDDVTDPSPFLPHLSI